MLSVNGRPRPVPLPAKAPAHGPQRRLNSTKIPHCSMPIPPPNLVISEEFLAGYGRGQMLQLQVKGLHSLRDREWILLGEMQGMRTAIRQSPAVGRRDRRG